jgi:adenosine deaminase
MRQNYGPSNFHAFRLLQQQTTGMLQDLRMGVNQDKSEVEKAWLRRLPKAELHCHLGGIADAGELLEIAKANSREIGAYHERLSPWLDSCRKMLDLEGIEKVGRTLDLKSLRTAVPGVPEPLCTASFLLLFEQSADDLDRLLFGPCQEEAVFCGQGFAAYERFGDLQGSGLLQNEASIRAACRILACKAGKNNVRYLELRCSPANYTRAGSDQTKWSGASRTR